MSWYELDPSLKKYAGHNSDVQTEAIVLHARLDAGSKIDVDTSTDWAVVLIGVGTIASAILTAIFSYRGQQQQIKSASEGSRNQVRANAANLRNVWMEQLRTTASEFIQCAALIVNEIERDGLIRDHQSISGKRDQLLLLQVRIKLYVGKSSPLAKQIVDVSDKVLRSMGPLSRGERNGMECFRLLEILEDLVVVQLEEAWSQAKEDLGFQDKNL